MLALAIWTMALSAAWVGFTYLGYPILLGLLARWAPRPVERGEVSPSLTVIVAVHNGEAELPKKLENTLCSKYPGPLQVIIASDHSTDGTEGIARACLDERVTLVVNSGDRGKESAQAAALPHAVGEIVVFTDVSAEDFGEGSFDKGLFFQIPLSSLFNSAPSRSMFSSGLRPIQRDGGQRLDGYAGQIFWDVRSARYDSFVFEPRMAP